MLCTVAVASLAAIAPAQRTKARGESGLVGVKLYDTGMRLLQLYGNPDEILPLGAASGGRGGSSGGGGRGGGGDPGGTGGGGAGGAAGGIEYNSPFSFGDDLLFEQPEELRFQGSARGGGGQGAPPGSPGRGRGAGAAAAGGQFIRWVYFRNGCRYGFILDRFNRVVQIEAIGLQNQKVRTRRGIGFGDTFKEVMTKYQVPEGYQINGDTIVMRYLVRDKVAFRLNRLGKEKPHVVTGIVVAAGKT